MTDAPTQYLQALVCDGGVTDWERKFCASLIRQERNGRAVTEGQAKVLRRIVAAFQERTMRGENAGELVEAKSFDEMMREYDADQAHQALLEPSDPLHRKMFRLAPDDSGALWLTLHWGGYPYEIEMDRLKQPSDLLGWVAHLSEKDWPHMTPSRLGLLVKAVAELKGWRIHG